MTQLLEINEKDEMISIVDIKEKLDKFNDAWAERTIFKDSKGQTVCSADFGQFFNKNGKLQTMFFFSFYNDLDEMNHRDFLRMAKWGMELIAEVEAKTPLDYSEKES